MVPSEQSRYKWPLMREAHDKQATGGGSSVSTKQSPPQIEVRSLGPGSKHLVAVQKLWRAHSDTLGYLTEGAFEDYAHQRTILAALTQEGELAGYILYRRAYEKAVIVHLCISEKWRGQKLGRLLVNELAARTQNLRGIELTCRRDFEASKVWPNLGFIAAKNKVGRSKARLELTCWWRPNPIDDLFSRTQAPGLTKSPLRAALDANVFFDLTGTGILHEESLSLTATWVSAEVELCVTEEIFNEIERNSDPVERTKQRRKANEFEILRCAPQDFQRYIGELQSLFPVTKVQDASDLRQLARAIASGADVFVTRDEQVLSQLALLRYG
jgi:predicted nucleic acid-binding protein/GNAT superfamily N-acetyltransferase